MNGLYYSHEMKRISFLLILLLNILSARAQITGQVADNSRQPVVGANVVLLTPDSVLVAGTTTDVDGKFSLPVKKTEGNTDVVLTVSCVGYVPYSLSLDNIPPRLELPSITMETYRLDEVVVVGAGTVEKVDRRLLFPTKTVVKHSSGGYDLLHHLMLPGVRVDVVNKSVSVPVYINDKKATRADLASLRPDEVLYVEHVTEPGPEYDTEAESVINIMVKRRYSGILGGFDTTNAVTTGNGNNFAYAKYNYKLSEFGLNYTYSYGKLRKRHTDRTDGYLFDDGTLDTVDRTGIDTPLRYAQHKV